MKHSFFSSRAIIVPLIILNTLFVAYYLILSLNCGIVSGDDVLYSHILKQTSIGEFLKNMYLTHSGRYAYYALYGFMFSSALTDWLGTWFVQISHYIVGIILCLIPALYFLKNVHKSVVINMVLLFYNLFVLTNIDFAIFGWPCAQIYYLFVPLAIFLFYLLLKTVKKWYDYVLIVIFSVLIGGIHEIFTPVVLFILFIFWVICLWRGKFSIKELLKDKIFCISTISGIIILAGFCVNFFAPGNWHRIETDGGGEFVTPISVVGWAKAYAQAVGMFLYHFSFYIPYYLVIILLAAFIGAFYAEKIRLKSFKKTLLFSLLAFVVLLLVSIFPNVYLWGGFGLQRNYTHIVFFAMLYGCVVGFLFGLKFNKLKYNMPIFIGIAALSVIMLVNIKYDGISSYKFKQSLNQRNEFLSECQAQGVTDTVCVEPLEIPYTTDVKYHVFRLLKRSRNPQPMLYYFADMDSQEVREWSREIQLTLYNFEYKINRKEQ